MAFRDIKTSTDSETRMLEMEPAESAKQGHPKEGAVSFGRVHIRHYSLVIGDHPLCREGCPLSLGWEYSDTEDDVELNDFEAVRQPERKSLSLLKMTCREREARISSCGGLSVGEIRVANRRLFRARCTRSRTYHDLRTFFGE